MRVIIFAALISVALAHPGLVPVRPAGPVPAPEPEEAFLPIAIGPAILDNSHPIAIGPALIPINEPEIIPSPVHIVPKPIAIGPAIIPAPPSPPKGPLVQLILNINSAESAPAPAPVPVQPVHVVDEAPVLVDPVHVVDEAPVLVDPVHVVDVAPEPVVALEPAVIGVPVLPLPVVSPLEHLN